jgi:mycoredoxin
MTENNLVVYGVNWCGDCRRTQRFLNQNNIPYQWINIDQDKEAEKIVLEINRGFRSVPTIFFPDGLILVEPSNDQLAKKLQLNI